MLLLLLLLLLSLSLLCDRVQYYADAAQCEYDVTNAIYRMHNELQQATLQPRDVAIVVGITRVCFVIFLSEIYDHSNVDSLIIC